MTACADYSTGIAVPVRTAPDKTTPSCRQHALPSPRHPRRPHNGVIVCYCMQCTTYSARVALPCIVNGDDSAFKNFFLSPVTLTFDLDIQNLARFLYNAPNRQVSSSYV